MKLLDKPGCRVLDSLVDILFKQKAATLQCKKVLILQVKEVEFNNTSALSAKCTYDNQI